MPGRLDCGKRPPLSEWKSTHIRPVDKYTQVDVHFDKNHANNLGPRIIGRTESTMGDYRTLYYNDKNETENEVKKIIPHLNFGERLMAHDTKGKIFNAKYDIGKTSLSLTFPLGLSHEVTLLTFTKNCSLPLYSSIRNHHGFE